VVSGRLSVKQVTLALLVWIGVTTFLQVDLGNAGLLRWSGYSALTPVVAGALLPFRHTLLIAFINLVVSGCVYGFVVGTLSTGARVVVLTAVLLSSVLALVVCRVRLDREERLTRLMVARDRLTLLSLASTQVGNSLDVVRTARELADVAVPRFADFMTVDLFDSVLAGEEPANGPFEGRVALRRVAHKSVSDGSPQALEPEGPQEAEAFPAISVSARGLADGGPANPGRLLRDTEAAAWLARDPYASAEPADPAPARIGGPSDPDDPGPYSGITVPLRTRDTTLGVAVFVRHQRPDAFDADDVLLAEEIAARAAVCLDNAHRYTRERKRSLTLQHSLMPRGLPKNAAVEVASRYLPAAAEAGVGGDWFDVIPLSGARVALVVGDVVGHGVHASATMGRLRAAVRTLADIDLPPDELLTHLDDVVTRLATETEAVQDEAGTGPALAGGEIGATCLYAVYDPVSRDCVLARAGHQLPVLVGPDGAAEFIDLPAGPPLGLGSLPFESVSLRLPEGSLLALYTNGLVESRRWELDRGLRQLLHTLNGAASSLETTCDTVLKALVDEHQTDDIALLLARTRGLDAQHVVAWDLAVDPASVAEARELATEQLAAWGLDDLAITTELVVSELVTNAIRYGVAPVQLRLIREKTLICEVADGSSTAPHLRRARTLDEGGRGLFIVAQLTDRWGTRHDPAGKTIWSELSFTPTGIRLPSSNLDNPT
jgi:serine phosphatase RsbU (regulator of sigma subunit)/anti-sigma regulatory factor (Ser/Thr protein kinase)